MPMATAQHVRCVLNYNVRNKARLYALHYILKAKKIYSNLVGGAVSLLTKYAMIMNKFVLFIGEVRA